MNTNTAIPKEELKEVWADFQAANEAAEQSTPTVSPAAVSADVTMMDTIVDFWSDFRAQRLGDARALSGEATLPKAIPAYWVRMARFAEDDLRLPASEAIELLRKFAAVVWDAPGFKALGDDHAVNLSTAALDTPAGLVWSMGVYRALTQMGLLVSPGEAARALGVAQPRLSVLLDRGEIASVSDPRPSVPINRRRRVLRPSLDAYLAVNPPKVKAPKKKKARTVAK